MILVRELSDEEIIKIASECKEYGQAIMEIKFARALFEAAQVKQNQQYQD